MITACFESFWRPIQGKSVRADLGPPSWREMCDRDDWRGKGCRNVLGTSRSVFRLSRKLVHAKTTSRTLQRVGGLSSDARGEGPNASRADSGVARPACETAANQGRVLPRFSDFLQEEYVLVGDGLDEQTDRRASAGKVWGESIGVGQHIRAGLVEGAMSRITGTFLVAGQMDAGTARAEAQPHSVRHSRAGGGRLLP